MVYRSRTESANEGCLRESMRDRISGNRLVVTNCQLTQIYQLGRKEGMVLETSRAVRVRITSSTLLDLYKD
jgi:hypothetical protein